MSSEKGKFSTDISQSLIDEAMKSVDKAKGQVPVDPAAAEVDVPIDPNGGADPASAPVGDAAKEIESLKAMVEMATEKTRELSQKLKDEHERTLRAMADLENYKKRAAKERDEIQKFGSEKMLKDFLPVLDNFDRALEHSKVGGDTKSLEAGVTMVRKLFEDALGRHGVKSFESIGKLFDPNQHEAMGQLETADVPANQVVKELVRGFTLNDRLVRPALVMVAKPPAPKPPEPAPGTNDSAGNTGGSAPQA